jgi:hypothetical protein
MARLTARPGWQGRSSFRHLHPSVVRAAGRVLAREHLDVETLDELWRRSIAADRDALKRSVFVVFGQQGRWPRLVLGFRAVATEDEDLQRRGTAMLDSVLASWNRAFTDPTPAQLEELQVLEPTVSVRVGANVAAGIGELVRLYARQNFGRSS